MCTNTDIIPVDEREAYFKDHTDYAIKHLTETHDKKYLAEWRFLVISAKK